jgi:REP element-mobilizing transposase RayT
MPQSLSKILVHLIFSTKNRAPLLLKPIRPELHKYMSGILEEWDSPGIIIGSVADHAHILFTLSKNHALSKIVEQVKKGSSKWINTRNAIRDLPLAGRLRCVFGQPVERSAREIVHFQPGGTSSDTGVPGRTARVLAQAPGGIR